MFSINSKVFISCEAVTRNATIEEIGVLIKKRKNPYVLSFHNGFKNFDYTQIESMNIKDAPKDALKLTFINPSEVIYTIEVDRYQRIYTDVRGYVPAYKVNDRDIFIDNRNHRCKLINTEVVTPTDKFISLSSKYNRSLCCNEILIKDD